MAKKETKAKATKKSKKPAAKAAGKVDAFSGPTVRSRIPAASGPCAATSRASKPFLPSSAALPPKVDPHAQANPARHRRQRQEQEDSGGEGGTPLHPSGARQDRAPL